MKYRKFEKLPTNIKIKWTKCKDVYGQVHEHLGKYTIEINAANCITMDGNIVKETIIHELAHIIMYESGLSFYTHNKNFYKAEKWVNAYYGKKVDKLMIKLFDTA